MKSTFNKRFRQLTPRASVAGLVAATLLASALAPATAAETPTPAAAASASYTEQVLAKSGDNGIDPELGRYYRIPALADLGNGVVLASYDGRPDGGDSPSPNSIVQRRSTDGGKTWAAPTYIARGQVARNGNLRYGFSDPSYIVDKVTGDVFAFFVYSKDVSFQGSGFGNDDADRNITSAAVAVSKDKGLTWSMDPGNMPNLPPADYAAGSDFAGYDGPLITDVVKPVGTTVGNQNNVGGVAGVFAASGEGIQLQYGAHKGRLIQQFTGKVKQADGSTPYQAYSVYSDDHGKTWQRGAFVGTGMDENKTVELSNGDVMLNSRASSGGQGGRKIAISSDGGQTYGPVTVDTNLVDPVNNASITRMFPNAAQGSADAKMLLFSNANSNSGRSNGTIRYSCNDGKTWSAGKQFKAGYMAYSTTTALSDGSFGILYESDGNAITFGKYNAEWLEIDCGAVLDATLTGNALSAANGASFDATLTVRNNAATTLSGATATFTAKAGWAFGSVVVPDVAAGASVDVKVPVTVPDFMKAGNVSLTANLALGASTLSIPVQLTVTGGATTNIVGLDIKGAAGEPTRNLTTNPYAVGNNVPYTFNVSSLSNIGVNAVPTAGNFSPLVPADLGGAVNAGNCRWNNLAVGASYSCATPRHLVTADELADGFFVPNSTWNAVGSGATTKTYTITGAEVDLIDRKPSLSLSYAGGEVVDVDGSGFASVGDTVTYTSVVTNNGNVRLTAVTGFGAETFALAAGESKTATSLYTLTEADVAANKVAAKGLAVNAKNGNKVAAASVSAAAIKACSDELCGQEPPIANRIPQAQISIESVSSQELTGEAAPNGPAAALLDGDTETFWHTKWSGTSDAFPHSVVFNLGKSHTVTGFEYTQRQNNTNGKIKDYEIYVSDSLSDFGTKVASGSFTGAGERQRITIEGGKAGRYVKLVGLNSIAGNAFGGGAEVNIGGIAVAGPTESPSPTAEPTVEPTTEPTASPSPSAEPTVEPTTEPTASPSPSVEPTVDPTTEPTASESPSTEPSVSPTASASTSAEPSVTASASSSASGSATAGTAGEPSVTLSGGKLAAGDKLVITASGFKPGSTATFTLHSDPIVLGTAVVAGNGTVTLSTTIPANVPAGAHTVIVSGTGIDGKAIEARVAIEILSAGVDGTSAATATASKPADDLANTGFGALPFALGGGILLLLGAVVLIRQRKIQGARH